MTARHADLQLDEHLRQQRIEARVTRVAWPLLYLLLGGVALGLLGQGPLADASIATADGRATLEYRRFATVRSTTPLAATLAPREGAARLVLAREWLDAVELRRVTPWPRAMVSHGDAVEFAFDAATDAPVRVRLFVEPRGPGRLRGWFAAGDGPRRPFGQLVYP
jgi:hypothetical protein